MEAIKFTWDEEQNIANQKKHKVSFEEARTVFYDDHARLIHDPDHSNLEDRFILLGMSYNLRLLVVVHAYRESAAVIRIISARKATKLEAKNYKRNR